MNARRVCIAAAVLVLALAIVGVITEPKSCGDDRGLGPVVALELSANNAQVHALLTTPECRAALRENTLADIFVFIPAFTTFLIAAAFLLKRGSLAVLFAFAAICDWVEDTAILRILESSMPGLSTLALSSHLKFFALSVGVILLGWAGKTTARAQALVMISGGVIALCGLAVEHRLLMPGTLIAWLSLAAFAIKPPARDAAAA